MPEPLNEYLEHWLVIATDRLCEESRARLRAELEEHIKDAVQALTCGGIFSKMLISQWAKRKFRP